MPKRKGLSEKAARFAVIFASTDNATQAYLQAGYKDHGDDKRNSAAGVALTKKAGVAEYIEELRAEARCKLDLRMERVLVEIAGVAFSNVWNYLDDNGRLDLRNVDPLAQVAVSEIKERTLMDKSGETLGTEVTLKLHNKWPALEKLAHIVGLKDGLGNEETRALKRVRFTLPKPDTG